MTHAWLFMCAAWGDDKWHVNKHWGHWFIHITRLFGKKSIHCGGRFVQAFGHHLGHWLLHKIEIIWWHIIKTLHGRNVGQVMATYGNDWTRLCVWWSRICLTLLWMTGLLKRCWLSYCIQLGYCHLCAFGHLMMCLFLAVVSLIRLPCLWCELSTFDCDKPVA